MEDSYWPVACPVTDLVTDPVTVTDPVIHPVTVTDPVIEPVIQPVTVTEPVAVVLQREGAGCLWCVRGTRNHVSGCDVSVAGSGALWCTKGHQQPHTSVSGCVRVWIEDGYCLYVYIHREGERMGMS